MSTETNPTPAAPGIDGKTIAILSYFTWIGWIIAFVLYNSNKSQLAAYHLRQSLTLMILGILVYIVQIMLIFIPFLGWAVAVLLWIGLVVLWVLGLVAAINGQEKPAPVIGSLSQSIFSGIK
ncbi:MAG: hypothetical protein E6H08_11615 [Bacteroidetes bacterium]|nr:MAG: hypothetical protein E6H08_11615 [Bacteroidota bacterium]